MFQTVSLLQSLCQLCHMDKDLSHTVWLQLYPRLWKLFSERQQQDLASELGPFLCSGSHVIQKDCHPSAIHTFLEAVCQCVPVVPIRPVILKVSLSSYNIVSRI